MATEETEGVDGAMVVIGDRCYFIPREELRSYRVPDDVAESVVDHLTAEVSGFAMGPDIANVFGVKFDPKFKPSKVGPKPPLQMSSLMAHAITIIYT